jgi:hypothetical protein
MFIWLAVLGLLRSAILLQLVPHLTGRYRDAASANCFPLTSPPLQARVSLAVRNAVVMELRCSYVARYLEITVDSSDANNLKR